MSNLNSSRARCLVLLLAFILLPVTYLLSASGKVQVNEEALDLFDPLPAVMKSPDNPVTDAKVTLGRILYYDSRLSANQQISCNSCHPLTAYGAETKPVSLRHKAQKGTRNAPTVQNAEGHFIQFWEGQVSTTGTPAKGAINNPGEIAKSSNSMAVQVIKSMPDYVALFQKAFPNDRDDPVTYKNMALAIGAFESELVNPSRWDAFLQGDQSALSDAEKSGFNTFVATGCQWCHYGPYIGGASYQRLSIANPLPDQTEQGLNSANKGENDRTVFKVPSSLRNIKKNGPYSHDGSAPALSPAIRNMAVHQRGLKLTDAQIKAIETWMDSLTGRVPMSYIQSPELPKSTPQTPGRSSE